ncbi:hypothetical protein Tco_1441435, partial [Tanacetum coccineum]
MAWSGEWILARNVLTKLDLVPFIKNTLYYGFKTYVMMLYGDDLVDKFSTLILHEWDNIIMANLPPPNHVADLPEDDQEEQLISMDKSKITRKQSKASKPRHENQKSTRPKPKPKTLAIHKDHSCISR